VFLGPGGEVCYRYVHGSAYQTSGANQLSDDRRTLTYGRSYDAKERAMQEAARSSGSPVNVFFNPGPKSGQEDELVGQFVHTGATCTATKNPNVVSYRLVRHSPRAVI
jgi:hypothetical protein